MELKVDLLVLLSDVDGLYNGPSSDPQSRIVYILTLKRNITMELLLAVLGTSRA
jgi:glutamate 5-kinase